MTRGIMFWFTAALMFTAYSTLAADDEDWRKHVDEELERGRLEREALADELEEARRAGGPADRWRRLHIGGYAELHINDRDADNSDFDTKEIDLHRLVLFFGWDFTERIRFYSELEIEHNGVEADPGPLDGEVEIEQAYVEFDLTDDSSVLGGVFLLPIGIINLVHEPPTFYGVERPVLDNVIIPTTWWEGGAQYTHRWGNGLEWNIAFHSGLKIPTTGSNAFRVRSGRQKVSEADFDDQAVTTRLIYTGIPGLVLAGSIQ